eukprot:4822065-Pyramimonas_sp.AAC.1
MTLTEYDDVDELPEGVEKMIESKEGGMQADGDGATPPGLPPCGHPEFDVKLNEMESVEAVEVQ